MLKLALILNSQVHAIEEIDATDLNEIYEKYRSRDLQYIDITSDAREIQEGWPVTNGVITEPAPEPTPSLDELKAAQWQKIKTIRDSNEESGFPYLGKTLDSDPISVQRIAIAVQAAQTAISASQAFTLDWTCADNSVLTMTADQVVGMSVALAQYSNTLHETARQLREQTDAAATAEEVEAIVWPT